MPSDLYESANQFPDASPEASTIDPAARALEELRAGFAARAKFCADTAQALVRYDANDARRGRFLDKQGKVGALGQPIRFLPELRESLGSPSRHGVRSADQIAGFFLRRLRQAVAITPESRMARQTLAEANPVHSTPSKASEKPRRLLRADVAMLFDEIDYYDSAQKQLDLWMPWYRIHILANVRDPKIAAASLDLRTHTMVLSDPDADVTVLHNGKLMIESLLWQAPKLTFGDDGSVCYEHMIYWKIVALHLRDERLRDFLQSNPAHTSNLRTVFHHILWRDTRPASIRFYRQDAGVWNVNETLADLYGARPLSLPRP